jgi:prepilin-type N-terminal cleavage/methylation domain-containing protein
VVDLKQFRKPGGESGFTLAEMLIAMAIFIIAATVAFLLYDNAQRSFKKGEEATEQQQVTRVAFDKLISDLRMAGFNYNPTGHPNRPDEQIEGAWATAVTLRADFDAEDPTQNATPETTLATGSPFSVVSTGNDEIVTYALAKDAGGVGGETLTFFADKDSPRNTSTEQIDVNNVALTSQNDPPYILYRISLDSTGAAVKEPLADNIKLLAFTYYDANGAVVNPANMGGSEATANKANRAKVRRVTVDVVGMTPNDEIGYTDSGDAITATQKRRKFDLISDVEPRNLGMVGAADPDNTPPTTPTGLGSCQGHCGGLLLTWNPNPATEAVSLYNIKYGTSAASLTSLTTSAASPAYIPGLSDASTYYFAIQAQDAAGNKSNWTANIGPISLSSNTTPLQVQNLAASPAGTQINLSWDPVGENTDAGASAAVGGCDPNRPTRRDSGGYKVYRKKNPSGAFTVPGGEDSSFVSLSNTYSDSGAVLCATYGYRVAGIDGGCSAPLEGAPSSMASAATSATDEAAKPTGGTAQIITGNHSQLSWNPVTQDTASPTPHTIAIERYNLYDALVDTALGETPSSVTYVLTSTGQLTCSTPTTCIHNNGGASNTATRTRWYKVAAATDCSSPFDEGLLSDPFELKCNFSGTPVFTTPTNGANVTAGTTSVALDVSGGSSTYTSASFTATPLSGGPAIVIGTDNTWSSSSPNFSVNWNATGLSGNYRLDAVVTQADGCARSVSINITLIAPVACCLSITSANVITQGALKKELRITFDNFCGVTLTVDQMTIQMTTDPTNNDAKMSAAEFDSSGAFFTDSAGVTIESTPYTVPISPAKTLTAGTHALTLEFKSNISNCAGSNSTFTITLRYTRPETGATTYTCTLVITSAIVTCI